MVRSGVTRIVAFQGRRCLMRRFRHRNLETARQRGLAMNARPFYMVIMIAIAGCSPYSSPRTGEPGRQGPTGSPVYDSTAPIRTDRTEYILERSYRLEERPALLPRTRRDTVRVLTRSQLAVVATYRNRTPSPVFVGYCGDRPPLFHLEKRVGANWVTVYRPVCTATGHEEPFTVEPGETYTDTVTAYHLEPPIEGPRFRVDSIPGRYRLVFQLYSSWTPPGYGEVLPLEARTSNEFLVRPDQGT